MVAAFPAPRPLLLRWSAPPIKAHITGAGSREAVKRWPDGPAPLLARHVSRRGPGSGDGVRGNPDQSAEEARCAGRRPAWAGPGQFHGPSAVPEDPEVLRDHGGWPAAAGIRPVLSDRAPPAPKRAGGHASQARVAGGGRHAPGSVPLSKPAFAGRRRPRPGASGARSGRASGGLAGFSRAVRCPSEW